jgi:hypothetical protein
MKAIKRHTKAGIWRPLDTSYRGGNWVSRFVLGKDLRVAPRNQRRYVGR